MDLVYPNIKSRWESNELKFSLRSAEKHLKFDKVVIVGYLPPFLSSDKVMHIPFTEQITKKWKNVADKFDIIINHPDISEDFIYMNDDFWLLQDYPKIPYLHRETLADLMEKYRNGVYWNRIKRTYECFPTGLNYELHFPMVFNKEKLKKVIKKYGWEVERRSAYCNEYQVPSEYSEDHKILNIIKNLDQVKDFPFLSANDEVVLHPKFAQFMHEKFPNCSKYELNQEDMFKLKEQKLRRILEIYKQKNPAKYEQRKEELERKIQLMKLQL